MFFEVRMVRVDRRIHHRPDNVVAEGRKGIAGCIRLHGAYRFGDESFDGKVRPNTVDSAMGRQLSAAITRGLRYALVVAPNQLSNRAAFERCKTYCWLSLLLLSLTFCCFGSRPKSAIIPVINFRT